MIISNNKPIRVIGYAESSLTQEFVAEIQRTHACQVMTPEQFCVLADPSQFQYIVSLNVDFPERRAIIDQIDQQDLVTVIHDSAVIADQTTIGGGTFVFPFCNIGLAATVGRHCVLAAYSMIGHHAQIGRNCVLRPSVIVTGKSQVGDHCVFNLRSTVTNQVQVADSVQVQAFSNVICDVDQPGRYAGRRARKIT